MRNSGDLQVAIRVTNTLLESNRADHIPTTVIEIMRNQITIMHALLEIGESITDINRKIQ